MSKYEAELIDGVYTYGPAHDRRQRDAEEALEAAGDVESSIVLTVLCAKAHTLATVHEIPADVSDLRHVIRISPTKRHTPDLHKVNTQLGLSGSTRVFHGAADFVDPLHAPDDRDVEASCRCGSHELDRAELIRVIGRNQRDYVACQPGQNNKFR